MRYIALLLVLLGMLPGLPAAFAQKEIGFWGAHFQIGIPQGAFADSYDKIGFGGDLDLYFRLSENLPFYAGVNLSMMGFENYQRRFEVGLPGGFVQDYRLRVSSNLFSGYGGLRVMPSEGRLRPYAEGLIGFKNFYRSNRLEQQPRFSNGWEEVDRETEGSWTLGYGGSAGVMILFGKSEWIGIDLKCAYLAGGDIRFYRLKEEIDPGQFEQDPFSAFTPLRSVSHMLIPQIGVVIRPTIEPEEKPVLDFTR
jgi:hypothetical protein